MSAHAEVCHNTLVDFTGEEAFEAPDDLASGPADLPAFFGPVITGEQRQFERTAFFGPLRGCVRGRCHRSPGVFIGAEPLESQVRMMLIVVPTSPPILSNTSVESPIIRNGRSDVKKRLTEAQIIVFLREAEAGLPVKDLCRRHGFSEASYSLWRSKFCGMSVSDAKRLKELETENGRLKKLLPESQLEIEVTRAVLRKTW